MGAALEILVECETATDVWTDLTSDVMASEGLNISYGIAGDKPMDVVAGTGECSFTLLGLKYSFHHADALAGFVFGAPIRVILHRASDGTTAASSMALSGTLSNDAGVIFTSPLMLITSATGEILEKMGSEIIIRIIMEENQFLKFIAR